MCLAATSPADAPAFDRAFLRSLNLQWRVHVADVEEEVDAGKSSTIQLDGSFRGDSSKDARVAGQAVPHGAGEAVNVQDAIEFVRANGIVLESARGPVPSLAEAIAGEAVHGSWWAHPRASEIFRITRAVRASEHVLVCRLMAGRMTYVHRRLWPSMVRANRHFAVKSLARVDEQHTGSGRHLVVETPFPEWVPAEVALEASRLSEQAAWAYLQGCVPAAFGSS